MVHEMTAGELFVDVVVMPLLGVALVAVLVLIIAASAWASVAMGSSTLNMINA